MPWGAGMQVEVGWGEWVEFLSFPNVVGQNAPVTNIIAESHVNPPLALQPPHLPCKKELGGGCRAKGRLTWLFGPL